MPTAVPARWVRGGTGFPRAPGDANGSEVSRFEAQGVEIIEHVLDEAECRIAAAQVDASGIARGGERGLLEYTWCRDLARRIARHFGIARRLPPRAVAVQATLFDKSPAHNWLVALHQDLAVPVRERIDLPAVRHSPADARILASGVQKGGVLFVQPALSVLERLVAVRLHLDDCGSENGALRVVPRSHRFGRLSAQDREALREAAGEVLCSVPRGGVLLMRPLLLHASSKSSAATPRRVIHFVFGPPRLSDGLAWHDSV